MSRTVQLPSFICTTLARSSWQLDTSQREIVDNWITSQTSLDAIFPCLLHWVPHSRQWDIPIVHDEWWHAPLPLYLGCWNCTRLEDNTMPTSETVIPWQSLWLAFFALYQYFEECHSIHVLRSLYLARFQMWGWTVQFPCHRTRRRESYVHKHLHRGQMCLQGWSLLHEAQNMSLKLKEYRQRGVLEMP